MPCAEVAHAQEWAADSSTKGTLKSVITSVVASQERVKREQRIGQEIAAALKAEGIELDAQALPSPDAVRSGWGCDDVMVCV